MVGARVASNAEAAITTNKRDTPSAQFAGAMDACSVVMVEASRRAKCLICSREQVWVMRVLAVRACCNLGEVLKRHMHWQRPRREQAAGR